MSLRNFVGGSLGGISGILVFSWLGFWWMLSITIVTTTLGWWHQEVGAAAVSVAKKSLKSSGKETKKSTGLIQWASKNQGAALIHLILIVFIPTTILMTGIMGKWVMSDFKSNLGILISVWIITITFALLRKPLDKFWEEIPLIVEKKTLFFIIGLGKLMKGWVMGIGQLITFTSTFISFLALIFLPLVVVVGTLRQVVWIFTRTNHWLCLVVTLVVTTISAFIFENRFVDLQWLLGVALMTGLSAGGLSAGLGRLMPSLMEKPAISEVIQIITQANFLENQLTEGTSNTWNYFSHLFA